MARTIRTWTWTVWGLCGLWGCSSLIGVEEPTDVGVGGSPAGGSSAGGGQSTGGAGASDPSSGGGGDGSGGTPSGGAGASGGGSTGGNSTGGTSSGGVGSGGMGGSGAESGSGGALSTTVEGRVVDLFGRPMTDLLVQVTSEDPLFSEAQFSDGQGRFSVPDAPATYDVQFLVSSRGENYQRVYRFVGLTRRDPTLQVDDDPGEQAAMVSVTTSDLPAPQVGDLSLSVGNPIDILLTGDESGTNGSKSFGYNGQDPFPTTLRALFWKDAGLGSEFYALGSKSLALNDSVVTDVVLDTWEAFSNTGQVSGLIQAPGTNPTVEVSAFLNFADGASIPLQTVPWNSATQSFAMTVPEVASGVTLSVLACVRDTGYACEHKDGFSLGTATDNIEFDLPDRARLVSPGDGSLDVTEDSEFTWQNSDQGPCSLVVINDGLWHFGLRIITCDDKVKIGPDILGVVLPFDLESYWSVQSVGASQSTDEMTGPDGFLDPYFDGFEERTYPRGKNRPVAGKVTRSEYNMIYFAP